MNDPLRILVVDDDRRMARTLVDIFGAKGFQATAAHSGPGALEKVGALDLGCVLTDIKMPEVNGVELFREIKARRPELPVVLMTAYSADALVEKGLQEGAIACLAKPLDLGNLLAFLSFLRKERWIAIVDDDPQFCRTLGDVLEKRGFAVTRLNDPHQAVGALQTNEGVVLLDMKLNGTSGLDILTEIRDLHPHRPVIMVTGHADEMAPALEAALKLDIHACLYKPLELDRLFDLLTDIRRQELGRVLGAHTGSVTYEA